MRAQIETAPPPKTAVSKSSNMPHQVLRKTIMQAKVKQTPAQAYDAWYDEQVRLGLEDIEAGRIVSHEEFIKNMAEHMKKLAKKHAQKAA